eukprot:9662686-Heterocapsa_arctica.AAC.1
MAHHSQQLFVLRNSVLILSDCFSLKLLSASGLLHMLRFHYQAPSVEFHVGLRLEIGNMIRIIRCHFISQLTERLGLVDLQIYGAQLITSRQTRYFGISLLTQRGKTIYRFG